MRHKLIISDYNRGVHKRVMQRAAPGNHCPLIVQGMSGIGKSLLLDLLQSRLAGPHLRMTAEEWMSNAVLHLTSEKEEPSIFRGLQEILIDNLEPLAGKTQTQAWLARELVASHASIVLVTSSELSSLGPLIEGLETIHPEICRMKAPTLEELRAIACLLGKGLPGDEPLSLLDALSPAEVIGRLTHARARRQLDGAAAGT